MSSSNATASAFGWDFQINLGLYLIMDEDLSQIERFKIEGDTEDIEIYFRNSATKAPKFIQAKSQENPYSTSTTSAHLTNAINSLLSVSENYSEILYGTNIEIPILARVQKTFFEGSRSKFKYEELPDQFKGKIDTIINASLSQVDIENFRSRLAILKIRFFGEDNESRYRVVKEKVIDTLSSLGVANYKCNKIFESLQREFYQMPSKRLDYTIEELGLRIILLSIDSDENQSFEKLDIPEELVMRIKGEFSDYVSEKQLDFQFISQVVGDYRQYKITNPAIVQYQKIQSFINTCFKQYREYFLQRTANVEQELIDNIIKVVLYRILSNQFEIDTITERMAL